MLLYALFIIRSWRSVVVGNFENRVAIDRY